MPRLVYVFWAWWPFATWIWPDRDFDPSLVLNINSIGSFLYDSRVFGESFSLKLLILRSLRPVTWKPPILTFGLTWHVTSFKKFRGALRPSHQEISNAASLVSLRSAVLELDRGRLIPPPPSQRKVAGYPRQCRVKYLVNCWNEDPQISRIFLKLIWLCFLKILSS